MCSCWALRGGMPLQSHRPGLLASKIKPKVFHLRNNVAFLSEASVWLVTAAHVENVQFACTGVRPYILSFSLLILSKITCTALFVGMRGRLVCFGKLFVRQYPLVRCVSCVLCMSQLIAGTCLGRLLTPLCTRCVPAGVLVV